MMPPFEPKLSVLQPAQQRSADRLTCLVDRGDPVQVSFFAAPWLRWIAEPHVAADNRLRVASLIDLAGMKASVVQKRAEAKDYLDLDAILQLGSVDLPAALAAGQAIYGRIFNPQNTLKALAFFSEDNLDTLPEEVQKRLLDAVKRVDLKHLPLLDRTG